MTDILAKFDELSDLKAKVSYFCDRHLAALNIFHPKDELKKIKNAEVKVYNFQPLYEPPTNPDKISIASTSTCIKSLGFCPQFQPARNANYNDFVNELTKRLNNNQLTTTGLKPGNPFTVGLLLPILKQIGRTETEPLVKGCIALAEKSIEEAKTKGGIYLEDYPPNAYLTYWILLGLDVWGKLDWTAASRTLEWSRTEFYRQISLFTSNADEYSDAFQLGYNLLIQYRLAQNNLKLKKPIIELGLKTLFDAQLSRGIWEKKDPLFVYGDKGDAYCFSFELLTALFTEFLANNDIDYLSIHEEHFIRAFNWITRNIHEIGGSDTPVWRSGHRVNKTEPESWATAEIYLFLQLYKEFLTKRIQRLILDHFNGKSNSNPNPKAFDDFYLPVIKLPNEGEKKLDELLKKKVLEPLKIETSGKYSLVVNLEPKQRVKSGILFGPPGTGKTAFVNAMASYLGWPIVTLDPSDFAKEGMHLIPNTTSRIFRLLMELEDTVVFFDEMEELIKQRNSEAGFEQKFLTTSLLPKLQNLADRARCLFFVATNFFGEIDEAARREGRFDFRIQIVPPSFEEKMRMLEVGFPSVSPEVKKYLKDAKVKEEIAWATRSEMLILIDNLKEASNKKHFIVESKRIIGTFKAKLNDLSTDSAKEINEKYHNDIQNNLFTK